MKTDGKRSWKFSNQVLIRINNNDVKKLHGLLNKAFLGGIENP
jgi:hypothetical protein